MSGAEAEAGCDALTPESAVAAIAGLVFENEGGVRYREEVFRPGLETPAVAEGTMRVADDGTLVKDQRRPRREISEIGEVFLSTRAKPEAEENLYPIPSDVRPMLDAIRYLLAGRAGLLQDAFDMKLEPHEDGWQVELTARAQPELGITVIGCGAQLSAMELPEAGKRARRFTFYPS